jgi:hypothetical protein
MAFGDPFRRALRIFSRSLESGTPGIEGQPKQGPWLLTTGEQQGWLPAEWGFLNHWQMDLDPLAAGGSSAIVEACVAAYAQTIAMCPGDHWKSLPNGGRERVTISPSATTASRWRPCTRSMRDSRTRSSRRAARSSTN